MIINNNREEGFIFKLEDELKIYELNKEILKNKELTAQLNHVKKMLFAIQTNNLGIEKVFDIKKFATLFAVSDLMNQKHALFRGNSRFYYNPITNLIEPIGREWGYLREETFSNILSSSSKVLSFLFF